MSNVDETVISQFINDDLSVIAALSAVSYKIAYY